MPGKTINTVIAVFPKKVRIDKLLMLTNLKKI